MKLTLLARENAVASEQGLMHKLEVEERQNNALAKQANSLVAHGKPRFEIPDNHTTVTLFEPHKVIYIFTQLPLSALCLGDGLTVSYETNT